MATVLPTNTSDAEERRDQLRKRGSKSRLSKQDEVEESDDISPGSDESAATLTSIGKFSVLLPILKQFRLHVCIGKALSFYTFFL